MFSFDSLIKITDILNKPISINSELKGGFERLRMRRGRILSYIIENNTKNMDESITLEDLLLYICKANSSKETKNDLVGFYLKVCKRKADKIALKYIHDNDKIVEAIRCYSLNARYYYLVSENQRKDINISEIEGKMAKYLTIIGQEENAALIFIKNKEFEFADRALRTVFKRRCYSRNEKAEKLLKWGKLFENDVLFAFYSQNYYSQAMSYATSIV